MHQNEIFEMALSHQTNKFNINLVLRMKRLMAGENGCHALFVRRNDLWLDKMVAIRSLSGESGLSPDKAMSESGRLTGRA